ncbi:DUF6286 domain-containing protein [Actinoplanes sp. NPDC051494]|uniref:DUF6286 domain-containing protein n=1 Tax=Actinoplanes sp. NPDC051494 TaxID=3363907 RepID=UPI0037BA33E4
MTHTLTSPAPAGSGPAMKAARPRTGSGRIGLLGPIMALVLTGLGVVLLHDAVAAADSRPGRTWSAALIDGFDRTTAEWWMIPAGVAIALLGIWMVVTAVRPRSRKTLAVTSQTGLFLRTRDVARLASAAADDVDGVLSAGSVAGRRTVTVTVESDRDGVADVVRTTVEQRLSALAEPPKVKVRVRAHWQSRETP